MSAAGVIWMVLAMQGRAKCYCCQVRKDAIYCMEVRRAIYNAY